MALSGLGENKGGLGTIELPTVYQELINIFDDVVGELRASAEAKGLESSSALIASIRFEPQILGEVFRFKLILADYYKWFDEGRKPGKYPPIDAILKWMFK